MVFGSTPSSIVGWKLLEHVQNKIPFLGDSMVRDPKKTVGSKDVTQVDTPRVPSFDTGRHWTQNEPSIQGDGHDFVLIWIGNEHDSKISKLCKSFCPPPRFEKVSTFETDFRVFEKSPKILRSVFRLK